MLSTQQHMAPTVTPSAPRGCRKLDYLELAEWQEFVESHPESNAFHHRSWIEAIQQHYGLDIHIPCLKSSGQIQAAIPFLGSRSLFGTTKLVCLPFSDCLKLLSREPHAATELTTTLMSDHPPCDSMSLRTDTALANMSSASDSVRHEVAVPATLSELLKKFKPTAHRNLHKAQRIGLQFEKQTDSAAVQAFYRLHLLTRRKLGVPVQPKRFFDRLQERVLAKGLGYIGLVVKAGQPVAAGFFLTFNQTVTYKYAASHPAFLADRPNDWLVYNALRFACEEGYRRFDFGISGRNQAGLRRFKSNWGADETDVHTVHIVGHARRPVEKSMLFQLTGCLIRHSPPVVCRSLGEVLYRFAI